MPICRNYISVIVSGDKTGRLMKYDPQSKETTVLLENLTFPNEVALSKDGDFILVADTTNCKIMRLWLKSSKSWIVLKILPISWDFQTTLGGTSRESFGSQFMRREGRF
ncbi:hypothetical protein HYC85_025785 [Camellia sinensis]|uniref:Strictosidine synthase conserved region domain-containing protein n=1 Tax=Camellia sinensis TaxID=4442 RepID=A0A7J7GBY6_CAMSI|nr:hypothetical protein HYC85_025785 [Camellia sinensis]